jgi:hypothetical protein
MTPVIRSIQGKVNSQIDEPEENGACGFLCRPDPVKPTPPSLIDFLGIFSISGASTASSSSFS